MYELKDGLYGRKISSRKMTERQMVEWLDWQTDGHKERGMDGLTGVQTDEMTNVKTTNRKNIQRGEKNIIKIK